MHQDDEVCERLHRIRQGSCTETDRRRNALTHERAHLRGQTMLLKALGLRVLCQSQQRNDVLTEAIGFLRLRSLQPRRSQRHCLEDALGELQAIGGFLSSKYKYKYK